MSRRESYSQRSRERNEEREKYKKRSGCDMKAQSKTGKPVMWGWRYLRGIGIIKFVATPCKDFKTKHNDYDRWHVTVERPFQAKETFTALYHLPTKRLIMKHLSMVANPKARNGGYWGGWYKPKN